MKTSYNSLQSGQVYYFLIGAFAYVFGFYSAHHNSYQARPDDKNVFLLHLSKSVKIEMSSVTL